jgi:lysophospholipase L1-like esterase
MTLASNLMAQETYKISPAVEKILFLGNSITYSGQYVDHIETYLRLSYPERDWEFINLGLPSETVSGLSEEDHAGGKFPRPDLHERLDRILKEIKPDLIFSNYGMNDGIYLPFDEARFEAYKQGQIKLHQKALASGAEIIHSTPPVYDEKKGAAYANVLDIYASWLVSQRYTSGWKVIDLHWPMRKFQEEQRYNNPSFALSKDGIHPGNQGHWIMARSLLKGLNEEKYLWEEDPLVVFGKMSQGIEVLSLVSKKNSISKDAWLSHIGHKRPGMKKGLPLSDARSRVGLLHVKIKNLTKN